MHVRKRIRDAAVIQLTGLTHTQDRVFPWRGETLSRDQLPAIKVMTPDQGPGSVTMIVEAIALTENADTLADWLDEAVEQIEAAINADRTLGGAAIDVRQTTSAVSIDIEGDAQVGIASLTYAVTVDTTGRRPAIKINDVTLERLRDVSLSRSATLSDTTHAGSLWRQRSARSIGDWTATVSFMPDTPAPAQAALSLKAQVAVKIYLDGIGGAFLSGVGVVSDIADDSGEGGENIRTVTITGNGEIA